MVKTSTGTIDPKWMTTVFNMDGTQTHTAHDTYSDALVAHNMQIANGLATALIYCTNPLAKRPKLQVFNRFYP